MSFFDLRKFLIENKLTRNSRILSEDIKFVDRDDALNVRNKNVQQRNKNYREKQARKKDKPFNTYSDNARRLLFEPDEITTRTGDYDVNFDPYDETQFDFTLQDLRNNAKGSWPRFVEGLNILFYDDTLPDIPDNAGMDKYPKATDWIKELISVYVKYMLGFKELPKDLSHYVVLSDPEVQRIEMSPTKKDKRLTAGQRRLIFSQGLFRLIKEYTFKNLKKIFEQYGAKGILMFVHEYIATVGKDYQQDIFQGGHMKDPSEKKPKGYRKSNRKPYAKVSPGQVSFIDTDPNFGKSKKDPYMERPYEKGDRILYDPGNGDIINWTTGEVINVPEIPGHKPVIRLDDKGRIIDYSNGKVIGNIKNTVDNPTNVSSKPKNKPKPAPKEKPKPKPVQDKPYNPELGKMWDFLDKEDEAPF